MGLCSDGDKVMRLFKPYIITGVREENNGKTYKAYELYEVSNYGRFVNWLLKKEVYKAGETLRMIIGYIEEEE